MNIPELNKFAPGLVTIGVIREENALSQNQSYGCRVTSEYEFDLITGGNGAVRTGKSIDIASYGTIFFRQPGMEVDGWGGYRCCHIRFSFNRKDVSFKPSLPLPYKLQVKNPEPLFLEFRRLYNAFLDGDVALDFLTQKCLSAILCEFYEASHLSFDKTDAVRVSPALSAFIKETAVGFEQAPQKRYTLEELSKQARVSKYFFCRAFKAVTGETVVECLNRLRIRMARQQLLESDLSVQEIMYACGFESSAQFFSLFKRHTGYTPKQYRNLFSFRDRLGGT